jgi:hypothetical protein
MEITADFYTIFDEKVRQYSVHILFFLVALLIAVLLAHPSLLITDEWITVNQLSQLHDGHQFITNEGNYGSLENGTVSQYFAVKNNYLAYPLFLSLISLPSYWLVDIFGGAFVYGILYLWTFLLITVALFINTYYKKQSYIGNYRWTTGLIVATFGLFFLNLYFWQPFPVTGANSYPEIMAIVFSYILLFAIMAVIIYEICRTIFPNPAYAVLGTVVCLTNSSYIFWTNFCKDHLLVAFVFTLIVLMAIKFLCTDNHWYLSGAFVFTGLLAWARPELALFVCIFLCIFVLYTGLTKKGRYTFEQKRKLLLSPLSTIIGAIPFFINNYLFTKNIFVPAWILWKTESPSAVSVITVTNQIQPGYSDTLDSLLRLFLSTINVQPATFFSDFYGVLLNPQSGSMGLLPLVPVFMIALFSIPVLWFFGKLEFSSHEKHVMVFLLILAMSVFFSYARGISGMNTSIGIVPDMRYLSPMYLVLNLVGLMVLQKIPIISDNAREILIWMMGTLVATIPFILIVMSMFYPDPRSWGTVFTYLDAYVSVSVYLFVFLFLLSFILHTMKKISAVPVKIFFIILCSIPFLWQIAATFLARLWGAGLGGYSFWIPFMLKLYGIIF